MKYLVILFFPLAVNAQVFKINFEELPKLIQERNEHSKGAYDLAAAAEKRTGHVMRSYLPSVEVKAGQEQFTTGDLPERSEPYGGIEAKLNVFNSGKDQLEAKIRDEELNAAKANASFAFRDELAKARKAYWELVSQKEVAKILENAIKDNQNHLSAANTRIKAGMATETDRIEFDMAKVELDQDLSRAKLQIQNLERDLRALLSLSDATKIETPAFVDHQHNDQILKTPIELKNDPSTQSQQAESKVAELQYKKARSEWLPSVDLLGSHSLHTFREKEYENKDDRWESVVGIQVSMKLFDGWNSQSESASQKLKSEGLKKQARQSLNELRSQLDGARDALILNHELIHDSELTIEKGRKYMTRVLGEYRRGVKNSIDVLNASERFFALQKRYADLRKDYQLARTELLKMNGE